MLAALLLTPTCRASLDDGRVRALRLRSGATLQTPLHSDLPVSGDVTLRVLIKRNEWDLGARNVLSLVNSTGDVRLGIGYNTSPWVTAAVTTNGIKPGSVQFGMSDVVVFGCPSGLRYEDWWVVYKAPGAAGGGNGYLRVYHNGILADRNLPGYPFDVPIPAGTDMTWLGGPLRLRIGDSIYGDRQDYQVIDCCMWTAALSGEDVAAIGANQIALLPDAVRRTTDIFWYARPNPDTVGAVLPELGATAGNTAFAAAITGDVSFISDVPSGPGWAVPDDTTPPDPGPEPLIAEPGDASLAVTMAVGDGTVAHREVILSKGHVWRYSTLARHALVADETEHTFGGLTPGAWYHATGVWEDEWGNRTERQLLVQVPGEEPPPQGESRSLHFRRDGAARTFTDETGAVPEYIQLPFNVDSATVRVVVRRNAGMCGPNLFFSSRADKVSDYGYSRFSLGLDQHGFIQGKVSDGQTVVVARSTETLASGVFEEIWLRYQAPTLTGPGDVRVYRRNGSTVVLIAREPIPPGDFTWKKWDAEFVLGGLDNAWKNDTIDYNLLEAALWTRGLTEAEMSRLAGRGIHTVTAYSERVGDYLFWYARPRADATRVEPDLGTSIGTAVIRPRNQLLGSPGTIVPLISTQAAENVEFSTDVPEEYLGTTTPPTLADAVEALACFAGLANASAGTMARLDVAGGDSQGVLDLEDVIILVGRAAATNPL